MQPHSSSLRELLEAIQGEASAYCEDHDGCDRIRRLVSLALEKVPPAEPGDGGDLVARAQQEERDEERS